MDAAGGLVEFIFGRLKDNVVGTCIVDGITAEGFFKFGEAGPGVVFRGAIRGDTPKIKALDSLLLGVENGGSKESNGGGKFFEFNVGGGLHVVAGAVVVEKEAGGEDLTILRGGLSVPCWLIPFRGVIFD